MFYMPMLITLDIVSATQSGKEIHVNGIQRIEIPCVMVAKDLRQAIVFIE